MELHGVEYIGLGAVASELTAEQRVRDTVAQLTERTKRLIGVGYLVDTKVTDTIPLEVWEREYPDDRAVNRNTQKIINHIKVRPDKKKHREMFIRFRSLTHIHRKKSSRRRYEILAKTMNTKRTIQRKAATNIWQESRATTLPFFMSCQMNLIRHCPCFNRQ